MSVGCNLKVNDEINFLAGLDPTTVVVVDYQNRHDSEDSKDQTDQYDNLCFGNTATAIVVVVSPTILDLLVIGDILIAAAIIHDECRKLQPGIPLLAGCHRQRRVGTGSSVQVKASATARCILTAQIVRETQSLFCRCKHVHGVRDQRHDRRVGCDGIVLTQWLRSSCNGRDESTRQIIATDVAASYRRSIVTVFPFASVGTDVVVAIIVLRKQYDERQVVPD